MYSDPKYILSRCLLIKLSWKNLWQQQQQKNIFMDKILIMLPFFAKIKKKSFPFAFFFLK
jgi:hypothetical protein